jgi:hypothetical protein
MKTIQTVFYSLPLVRKYTWKLYSNKPIRASKIREFIFRNDKNSDGIFFEILKEQGILFEKAVLDDLEKKLNINIPSISTFVTPSSLRKIQQLMKKNVPIIHSVPLFDHTNNTRGIADLLVHSSFIHKLVPGFTSWQTDTKSFYIPVEIKFLTLPLKTNGIHLRNTLSTKYAKGQLFLYNEAIKQDFKSPFAFIIGRRSKLTKQGEVVIDNEYSIGRVDFLDEDKHIEPIVKEGLDWLNSPRTGIRPHDITSVWQCSERHAEILRVNGIFSYMDPRCTAEMLNFQNKRRVVVDCILNTQRGNELMVPDKSVVKMYLPKVGNKKEYFVDFETVSGVLKDDMVTAPIPIIFLIGVGSYEFGKWEYRSFLADTLDLEGERKVIIEFINLVGSGILYHWSPAEPSMFTSAVQRQRFDVSLGWIDLYQVFIDVPVTIKGCTNFKLKDVAASMKKYGMIEAGWELIGVSDGLNASAQASLMYKKDDMKKKHFGEIVKYNEIDCQVIGQIVSYFRI